MAISRPDEGLDTLGEERVDVPFGFKALQWPKSIPAGCEVYVKGNFDATFASGPEDSAGWDTRHQALPSDGNYVAIVPALIVDKKYRYKYFFVDPRDGKEYWYPEGNNLEKTIKAPPKSAPKPVPAAPTAPDPKMVAAGRARIKAKVGEILSAAGTHEAAGSLDALFEELGTELDNIPGARDDQTALVVEVMAEFIREEDSVPRIIRRQFLPKEKVFSSMSELLVALEKGSQEYRKQVYNKLRINKDARKHFKLKETRAYDPGNPLGNESANKVFDRLCSERDFSALTPALRVSVESVANVSSRDTDLEDKRKELMKGVIERLKVVEKKEKGPSFIKKMKPDKTAKAVALLVQGGLIGTAFAAGALPSGLVWMGKSALEGATGVSQADVVKAIKTGEGKALWEKLKSHNLLAEWLHTDAGMGAILKNRVGSWAKRSIPLVGPLMWGHESITNPPKEKEGEHGEHDEHGAHEEGHGEHGEAHGAHGGHEEHDPHKDEAFIKTACAEAI